MKRNIVSTIKTVDQKLSLLSLKMLQEKNSLIILLFHGLFLDETEITSNVVAPQQRVTTQHFRQILDHFLRHDYTFVAPCDIVSGLNRQKRYVLITFDDGYFNNIRALPILKEFQAPAVFFISINHVTENKSFWWDVLYRERMKQGKPVTDILIECEQLKSKTSKEIENYLLRWFGDKALQPLTDFDRPFRAAELKEFATDKLVFLGNHTSDHAILTNYRDDDIKTEISSAQNAIQTLTGQLPIIIAYPDGRYSDQIIRISEREGLLLGVTGEPRKNYLPLDSTRGQSMRLGRFTLVGSDAITTQCELIRSDVRLYRVLRNCVKGRKRKHDDRR
jgi:peptidoglycan/xylan/chitin deacetylase (PgdA/CDA1 family)